MKLERMIPRVMIAGTGSGCGKTTITCAILQALKDQGRALASFKCGPDYIDTMFHEEILGIRSSNLDSFFHQEDILCYLLDRHSQGRDLALIEGVMGYYDGGAMSERYSSYEIAVKTRTPAVLAIDCKGIGNSILALLDGYYHWQPDSQIRGVILNKVSPSYYPALKALIESHYQGRIKVLGYLSPLEERLQLKSRHLGLITSGEISNIKAILSELGSRAAKTIDLDGLMALGKQSLPLSFRPPLIPLFPEKVTIAVARDEAFCFHYKDNLQLLKDCGADLLYFSPLRDPILPPEAAGLLLPGGYPELYKEALAANETMRQDICRRLSKGLPAIAECGGFMYLTQAIDDSPMAGFLHGSCENQGRLTRFGYVTLKALQDSLLLKQGEELRGHEFHHYDCPDCGAGFLARKINGKSWNAVHTSPTLYAGYPHIHFYSNLKAAENFYLTCLDYKRKKGHE